MEVFYVKITGTSNTENTYSAMVAATTLDVERIEKEYAILWLDPLEEELGEGGEAASHAMYKSMMARKQFEIEFYPFSNHHAVNGTTVLQNTDAIQTLYKLRRMKRVWVSEPEVSGRELPPRYIDATNFPQTVDLLPMCVVCDMPATTKTDEGTTEMTMQIYARVI